MVDIDAKIKQLLVTNPKYREILELAVKHEEENLSKTTYQGWAWHEVRAYPAQLMKLVTEGLARITYNSVKYTNYKLVDRSATKKALVRK